MGYMCLLWFRGLFSFQSKFDNGIPRKEWKKGTEMGELT
jgi:hypothetical protein